MLSSPNAGIKALHGDHLLLIHDDPAGAQLIQAALAEGSSSGEVECVTRLSEGLQRLKKKGIGAIIVNLFLPDSQGLATFDAVQLAAPHIPILVLSTLDHEAIAKQAVQRGAHDYLLPGHLDSYALQRALLHAIQYTVVDEALFIEKERAQVTLNSIGDAVLSVNIAGNVTYLNPVAERMTGWPQQEAIGRPLAEVFRIIDGVTRVTARDPLQLAIQENKTVGLTENCTLIRRDGVEAAIEDSAAPIHDRNAQATGAVIVFHDVSEARAMAQEMSHLARHDVLTNLPNRTLLDDRLTQAIGIAHRRGTYLAMLFVDLDRFKQINDSLGHAIGDELLQAVAKRLVACVRGSDTVSRQGGDEFLVLLSDIAHLEDAALSAAKILAALRLPYHIAEHTLHISASIGISVYPSDGLDADTLIQGADTAMYHAKGQERNNYQFFQPDMNARAIERRSLEGSLRHALEHQEFVLHYQPKINLKTGAVTGAEALIRWQHPERGLVSPAQFVPIAENCGFMLPIGQWALREACRQAQVWRDAGLWPAYMAVNVSAVEFRSRGFLDGVRAILDETRFDPSELEIELTESILMQDTDSTTYALRALKTMGIQLAVDDFGTRYSSLSYLRRFPIDAIKIDRSFVRDISTDPEAAIIVSAVISMGKSLKQRVVAEGVETQEQWAFLRGQECDEGQGYYFGRPVVAEEFARVLDREGSDTILKGMANVLPSSHHLDDHNPPSASL